MPVTISCVNWPPCVGESILDTPLGNVVECKAEAKAKAKASFGDDNTYRLVHPSASRTLQQASRTLPVGVDRRLFVPCQSSAPQSPIGGSPL